MSEVVVGVDGSAQSERALRVALLEASLVGDDVRVLHTWHVVPYLSGVPGMAYDIPPQGLDDRSGVAHDVVADAVADARQDTGLASVKVVTDVRSGDPGTELVAASDGADLLVLGSRRHGPFASALVGSATNYVLHHAHSPVLVVPLSSSPVRTWRRVVVGLDGSAAADEALRWAAARAEVHGCPLVVLRAWELVTNQDWFGEPNAEDYNKHIETWLCEHVADVLPDTHGVTVELRAVQDFASAGLGAATGPEDLLVVGSRGRSTFTDLLLGSVATQCVHHARSSVAVVRTGRGATS